MHTHMPNSRKLATRRVVTVTELRPGSCSRKGRQDLREGGPQGLALSAQAAQAKQAALWSPVLSVVGASAKPQGTTLSPSVCPR